MVHLSNLVDEEILIEEAIAAEEQNPPKQPGQKTKKQKHELCKDREACKAYWDMAFDVVNAWSDYHGRKIHSTKKQLGRNLDELLGKFGIVCNNYRVDPVGRRWLSATLVTKEDCEKYRKKIRRQRDKLEKVISLKALR